MRAACMREVSLGVSEAVSRTLIEMAEGLEAQAAALQAEEKPE